MSSAVTRGIRVAVEARFVPEHSSPGGRRFAFAYTVHITNDGLHTAQLMRRHWYITRGDGEIEEVEGEGVVGVQPVLKPGQEFEYTSGCVLPTPQGTMHGSYRFVREDGLDFEAKIAPFVLSAPQLLN